MKGGRSLPAWGDFDPSEIRELLPYVVVVELVGDPARYRVRLYGTAIAALRGDDLTGRFLDEPGALPPGLWPQFQSSYGEALAAREPVARLVSYRRPPNDTLEWQHLRVILPFMRNDPEAVAILLVAILPAGGPAEDPAAPEVP